MSDPINPLSRYRSYSYHHVLVACDSTQTARALAHVNEVVFYTRDPAERDPNNVQYFTPRQIQTRGLDGSDVSGKYIVVINGMTDADLIISNASWYTTTAAHAVLNDRFTSLAVEGEFDVIEPQGMQFLNIVAKSCQALGTDSVGVAWLLKTFFVGQNNTETGVPVEMITSVPPIVFTMLDVQGKFDAAGGHYHVEFVSIDNGTARLPQIMRLAEGISVNLPAGKQEATLKVAMESLEKKIREIYDAFYTCVETGFKHILGTATELPIKRVTYKIELAKPYDTDRYHVTDQAQQVKPGKGLCDEGTLLKLGNGMSIENAIQNIMNMSQQVKKDAEVPDETGVTNQYKIFTTIESDKNEFRVVYKVQQFPIVRNRIIEMILNKTAQDAKNLTDFEQKINNNLITFDYIYTGKNIDILNLEMKMQSGLAFLTAYTSPSKTLSDQNSYGDMSRTIMIAPNENRLNPDGQILKTPLFMGANIKDVTTSNSQIPSLTSNFNTALSRFASLETIEIIMEIMGNPSFLKTASVELRDTVFDANDPNINRSRNRVIDKETDIFQNWGTVPAIAKLNIHMPRRQSASANIDIGVMAGDYSEPFWYRGYYQIYGIKHIFNQGKFTQELHMLSLQHDSIFDSKDSKDKKATFLCTQYDKLLPSRSELNTLLYQVQKPDTYDNDQIVLLIKAFDITVAKYPGVQPEIVQAILLQESRAGKAFAGGKPKVNPKDPSYGITQFMIKTARAEMKRSGLVSNVDSLEDADIIQKLYDDDFALRLTASHIDYIMKTRKAMTGNTPTPVEIFKSYNGGVGFDVRDANFEKRQANVTVYATMASKNLLYISDFNKAKGWISPATLSEQSIQDINEYIASGISRENLESITAGQSLGLAGVLDKELSTKKIIQTCGQTNIVEEGTYVAPVIHDWEPGGFNE